MKWGGSREALANVKFVGICDGYQRIEMRILNTYSFPPLGISTFVFVYDDGVEVRPLKKGGAHPSARAEC
jgi:hypothetical protein